MAGSTTERIAVVFVHGQGEQTPMTDAIELARSMWRTDPRAGARAGAAGPPGAPDAPDTLAPVYSVPVYDQDASAQRRMLTREVDKPDKSGKLQVDFYQFYWADLMQGNRFAQLWTWFAALMARNPKTEAIPKALKPLRDLSMGIGLAIGWSSVLLAISTAAAFATPPACGKPWGELVIAGRRMVAVGSCRGVWHEAAVAAVWAGVLLGLTALLWIVSLLAAGKGQAPRLFRAFDRQTEGFRWLPVACFAAVALLGAWMIWTGQTLTGRNAYALVLLGATVPVAVSLILPRWRIWTFLLGLLLEVACCASAPVLAWLPRAPSLFPALPVRTFEAYAVAATLIPAAVAGLILWWLSESFLVPVMTESARLFSPSPCNVPNQDSIRKRGLDLLEALHASEAGYDRIVFLAHSLGTAVTYGLLTYYWGKVFGGLDHRGTLAERQAVETAAHALLTAGTDQAQQAAFATWREAVRAYGAALSTTPKAGGGRAPSEWRISDFVTIGSPLTYASLLMEPSDQRFLDEVEVYRRYATSPPQNVNGAAGGYSFTLGEWPHHAALFAATSWTNLYFPHVGIVWGDIIGGKIAGDLQPDPRTGAPARLGRGILDVALPHPKVKSPFTHGEYWPWPADARVKAPPAQIQALRWALRLFDDPATADAALQALGAAGKAAPG